MRWRQIQENTTICVLHVSVLNELLIDPLFTENYNYNLSGAVALDEVSNKILLSAVKNTSSLCKLFCVVMQFSETDFHLKTSAADTGFSPHTIRHWINCEIQLITRPMLNLCGDVFFYFSGLDIYSLHFQIST